jgi:uncharacterized membrane protein
MLSFLPSFVLSFFLSRAFKSIHHWLFQQVRRASSNVKQTEIQALVSMHLFPDFQAAVSVLDNSMR